MGDRGVERGEDAPGPVRGPTVPAQHENPRQQEQQAQDESPSVPVKVFEDRGRDVDAGGVGADILGEFGHGRCERDVVIDAQLRRGDAEKDHEGGEQGQHPEDASSHHAPRHLPRSTLCDTCFDPSVVPLAPAGQRAGTDQDFPLRRTLALLALAVAVLATPTTAHAHASGT